MGAFERWRTGIRFSLTWQRLVVTAFLWWPLFGFVYAGFDTYQAYRTQVRATPFVSGLLFWLDGGLMPFSYTALWMAGFAALLWRRSPLLLASAAQALGMIFIYSFYSHSDLRVADQQRYELQCAPAFLILAGAAWQTGLELERKFRYSLTLLALLVFLGVIPHLALAQKPFRPELEQELRFILESKDQLPAEALYLAPVPSALSTTLHVMACPVQWLAEPRLRPLLEEKRLIYFRDIWFTGVVGGEPFQDLDRDIKARCRLQVLREQGFGKGVLGFYEVKDCVKEFIPRPPR
jgi:hypothetical protein